jgi:hypothetical protein
MDRHAAGRVGPVAVDGAVGRGKLLTSAPPPMPPRNTEYGRKVYAVLSSRALETIVRYRLLTPPP